MIISLPSSMADFIPCDGAFIAKDLFYASQKFKWQNLFSVTDLFVPQKDLRCWVDLCDKESFQTLHNFCCLTKYRHSCNVVYLQWCRSKFSNLSNWKQEAWKNQGFNGIWTRELRDPGAMLYQLSYEATHWERGQFIEFISSRAVKWCEVYMK